MARINPAQQRFQHFPFQEADGLESHEFSDGAVWTDAAGRLYFGGIYGFNYCGRGNNPEPACIPTLIAELHTGRKQMKTDCLCLNKRDNINSAAYTSPEGIDFFELQGKAVILLHAEKGEYALVAGRLRQRLAIHRWQRQIAYIMSPPPGLISERNGATTAGV